MSRLRAVKTLAAVLVVLVLAGLVALVLTRDEPQQATVVRVVDGDTVVVAYGEVEHTVRLLNVDTPEAVAPGRPVECLGPEATAFLRGRLPAGAPVLLRFDEDRLDRYDRELAGVFVDDVLVNAEIARAGLGTAVVFEPNRRFYDDVLDTQQEARRQQVGLHSATLMCPAE